MADEDDFDSDEPEFEAAPEGAGGRGSKKKLLLIIAIPLVLVIGGGAAAYFTGLADPLLALFHKEDQSAEGAEGAAGHGAPAKVAESKAAKAAEQPIVNYELPDMLVNIDTGTRAKSFLKIKASVELNTEADIERVVAVLPKIVDNFQVYLRELKQEDLAGAAGMYKLREELLIRINAAVRPVQVKDVLFKEFIVQ